MRIKKYIIITLVVIISIPLVVIGINAYCDRNIVLKVAVRTAADYDNTYYYVLRDNQILESYHGRCASNPIVTPISVGRHYYLSEIYQSDRTIISESDSNCLLEYANKIERDYKIIFANEPWEIIMYYHGNIYTIPCSNEDLLAQLAYKVTGLSPIQYEQTVDFAPENFTN